MSASPYAFDLGALRIFLQVLSSGTMTAAARALGLTQPAVSQSVAQLEQRLGSALIDRGARPLLPSPAGEELAARARQLLADAEETQVAVRELGAATLPRVRIGLIDSFAVTAGPDLVKRLRPFARHLSMWSGISPNLGSDLLGRRLDFVVSTDAMEGLAGLERYPIMREPFILVVPDSMAQSLGDVRLADLARHHPFIRYSERSLIGAQIEAHLRHTGVVVPKTLEFDGTESVFAMVSAGLGWAMTTPLCLIHGHAGQTGLAALPLPGPAPTRSLRLVCRQGEFGTLGSRIAAECRSILDRLTRTTLRPIAPWAQKDIILRLTGLS